jgi:aminoglycoside phosphotransferase
MKRGISAWLHKFADAAERAILIEFKHQKLTEPEERAEFVQYLLRDMNDISSKHCPFLWQTIYDDSKAQQQVTIGCIINSP